MSLQNPQWYDYFNPFFWMELVATAYVIRGANGLQSELKRKIAPELKQERFILIKQKEDKNA